MATITSVHQRAIANLYTALFNRAPDAAGFGFWAQALANGVSLADITASFLGSPESTAIYTPSQSAADFVTSFYQTVFGRAPDAGGLAFWIGVLNGAGGVGPTAGRAALVGKIIEIVGTPLPAKPADLTDAQYADTVRDRELFAKKVGIGIDFAVTLQSNDLMAAKQALANLNSPATPTTPPAPVVDQTFTLTVGTDTLTGDAGNDTFTSAPGTLDSTDVIDGGDGNDTLNVTSISSTSVTPTLKGIEVLNVTAQGAGANITVSADSGIRSAGFVGSTATGTLGNVGNTALSVAHQNAGANFRGSTATELVLKLDAVGSAGARSTVNVGTGIDAPLATSYDITTSNAHVDLAGAGSLGQGVKVAATGANSLSLWSGEPGKVARLTVTGTGLVDFSGAALSGLTNVDAAEGVGITLTTTGTTALTANTGGGVDTIVANGASIAVLNTGAGNDVVTLNTGALSATARINLGAGDDMLSLAVSPNALAEIDGGLGEDTVNFTASVTGSAGPKLSNIEIVNVTATAAGTIWNLADAGATRVNIARSTATLQVDNVGAAALSISNQNAGASFNGSTASLLSLTLDTAGSEASKIGVNVASTATAYDIVANHAHVYLQDVSASMSELTVRASGINVLDLSANPSRLAVTGTGSVDFSGQALAALTSVQAGDGGIKLISTNATAGVLDITSGAGVDTITADGASIKTLNVGAGNDVVTLNGGSLSAGASVDLGDGDDVLISSAAMPGLGATINGGAGRDTLLMNTSDLSGISFLTGFEVLALGVSGLTVIVTDFPGLNQFAVANTGTTSFIEAADTTSFTIDNSAGVTAVSIGSHGVGTAATDVTLNNAAQTAGAQTLGTLTLARATVVSLTSSGTGTNSNVITTLANADNSVITIKGSADLTITNGLAATSLGSRVDASAFTGKLTITGSEQADTLIGGHGNDVIDGGSGGDTLTGGDGADTFTFGTLGAYANGTIFGVPDVVTDFVVGTDKLQFLNATAVASGQQATVQSRVSLLAAGASDDQIVREIAYANTTNGGVSFAVFGGNTYVFYESFGNPTGIASSDVFIKLTGVTSLPTFAEVVLG